MARDLSSGGANYARYAGIGMHFAVTLLVFTFAGYRLDLWLGSSPWLLLLGVGLGFAGGMISMVSRVKKVTAGSGSASGGTDSASGGRS